MLQEEQTKPDTTHKLYTLTLKFYNNSEFGINQCVLFEVYR